MPLALRGDAPALLEVRGEVYLPRAAFARMNEEREAAGEPLFANPAQRRGRRDAHARHRRGRQARLRAFTYQIVQPAGRPSRWRNARRIA